MGAKADSIAWLLINRALRLCCFSRSKSNCCHINAVLLSPLSYHSKPRMPHRVCSQSYQKSHLCAVNLDLASPDIYQWRKVLMNIYQEGRTGFGPLLGAMWFSSINRVHENRTSHSQMAHTHYVGSSSKYGLTTKVRILYLLL